MLHSGVGIQTNYYFRMFAHGVILVFCFLLPVSVFFFLFPFHSPQCDVRYTVRWKFQHIRFYLSFCFNWFALNSVPVSVSPDIKNKVLCEAFFRLCVLTAHCSIDSIHLNCWRCGVNFHGQPIYQTNGKHMFRIIEEVFIYYYYYHHYHHRPRRWAIAGRVSGVEIYGWLWCGAVSVQISLYILTHCFICVTYTFRFTVFLWFSHLPPHWVCVCRPFWSRFIFNYLKWFLIVVNFSAFGFSSLNATTTTITATMMNLLWQKQSAHNQKINHSYAKTRRKPNKTKLKAKAKRYHNLILLNR